MKCPNDQTVLVMSERAGVAIDYCPICRGVWLDRGELDKILQRAEQDTAYAPPQPFPRYSDPRASDRREQQPGYYKKKRKESWLSELFD